MGEHMHIIFDRYLESNTKDHMHEKRNKSTKSFRIEFSQDMGVDCSRDFFYLIQRTNCNL